MKHRKTALVVDDDESTRFVLTRALEGLGCEVTAVDDGAEVWECFGERHFDLLVLDLYMPGMNGFEVLRQIRQQVAPAPLRKKGPAMPRVVVVSGETNAASVAHAKAAGADVFLDKPVDIHHFEDVVRPLLAGDKVPAPDCPGAALPEP